MTSYTKLDYLKFISFIILNAFTTPIFYIGILFLSLQFNLTTRTGTNTFIINEYFGITTLFIFSTILQIFLTKIFKKYFDFILKHIISLSLFRLPLLILLYWFSNLEGNIVGFIFLPITILLSLYSFLVIDIYTIFKYQKFTKDPSK